MQRRPTAETLIQETHTGLERLLLGRKERD